MRPYVDLPETRKEGLLVSMSGCSHHKKSPQTLVTVALSVCLWTLLMESVSLSEYFHILERHSWGGGELQILAEAPPRPLACMWLGSCHCASWDSELWAWSRSWGREQTSQRPPAQPGIHRCRGGRWIPQ